MSQAPRGWGQRLAPTSKGKRGHFASLSSFFLPAGGGAGPWASPRPVKLRHGCRWGRQLPAADVRRGGGRGAVPEAGPAPAALPPAPLRFPCGDVQHLPDLRLHERAQPAGRRGAQAAHRPHAHLRLHRPARPDPGRQRVQPLRGPAAPVGRRDIARHGRTQDRRSVRGCAARQSVHALYLESGDARAASRSALTGLQQPHADYRDAGVLHRTALFCRFPAGRPASRKCSSQIQSPFDCSSHHHARVCRLVFFFFSFCSCNKVVMEGVLAVF